MNGANYAAAGPVDVRKQLIIRLVAALETDIHYYPLEASEGPINPLFQIIQAEERKDIELFWAAFAYHPFLRDFIGGTKRTKTLR